MVCLLFRHCFSHSANTTHKTNTMSVTEHDHDHSSILRVSGDSLESITLRSDLAARSSFLVGTLLEGVGVIEPSPSGSTTVELSDVIQTGISDTEYLEQWKERLEKEVDECEKQQLVQEETVDKTTELLQQMDSQPLRNIEDVQKELKRLESLM